MTEGETGESNPYVWDEADAAKLTEILNKKIGEMRPCPLCGVTDWEGLTGVVLVLIAPPRTEESILRIKRALPSLSIMCKNCGNTHFLNIGQLGLAELGRARKPE